MKRKLSCVLLVDDDPAINFLHSKVIRAVDCTETIAIAETGSDALQFLKDANAGKQTVPELILLDINMPVLNAWEFLDIYCKLPAAEKGNPVIIMLTTSLNPDDEVRAAATCNVKGFYLKPLDKDILQLILQKHFADRM